MLSRQITEGIVQIRATESKNKPSLTFCIEHYTHLRCIRL